MKKIDFTQDLINKTITSGNESKSKLRKKKKYPTYLYEYTKYLEIKNYSSSTIGACLGRTKLLYFQFQELFEKDFSNLEELSNLNLEDIKDYEDFLLNRVVEKEIKNETAYSCIKNLRLFLQFLKYKEIIDFNYVIPKKFMVTPSRINTVIPKNTTIDLIEEIMKNPNPYFKYRNLAIFLLLVNTGCRPLEISNIKLYDLNLTEKKIVLNSIKSNKRTLNLDPMLIIILKEYIQSRKKRMPECNSLFLKRDGSPISPTNIASIFSNINYKAFGKCVANARAYRHTYITNAIEDRNDFKEVSEAVGHKHWFSTLHYLHRSKKRLLNNTLKFDPIKNIEEED